MPYRKCVLASLLYQSRWQAAIIAPVALRDCRGELFSGSCVWCKTCTYVSVSVRWQNNHAGRMSIVVGDTCTPVITQNQAVGFCGLA